MPATGLATLVLMQLGEVVFGGVGSGLYGMVVFALVAVFDATVQSLLYERLYDELGRGEVPLGEAIRRAKARALAEDPRSRPAVTGFNLLGDPSTLVPGLGP